MQKTKAGFQFSKNIWHGKSRSFYNLRGWREGELNDASAIAVTPEGNLVVTDNHRAQVFDSEGNFLFHCGNPYKDGVGRSGKGDGEFDMPLGVAVDKTNGDIYIADANNRRIQVFDKHGIYLRKFGQMGSGYGQLSFPSDIEISNDGEIIVCDRSNYCILFFTKNGKHLFSFGKGPDDKHSDHYSPSSDLKGVFITSLGNVHASPHVLGNFSAPLGMACDEENIIIVDCSMKNIQVFDREGKFVSRYPKTDRYKNSNEEGYMHSPIQADIDSNGNLYIVDHGMHFIGVFKKVRITPEEEKRDKEEEEERIRKGNIIDSIERLPEEYEEVEREEEI